jgi:protein SCO1/2
MKTKYILATFCAVTLVGVLAVVAVSRHQATMQPAAPPAKTFETRGHIVGLDLATKTVRVAHEEIPGYMPAMTMPLPVKDSALLKGLTVGDEVQFQLSVTADDSWISRIEAISQDPATPPSALAEPGVPVATPEAASQASEVHAGEQVPDFQLVDQDGRTVRLKDFRGKAVVLTFIYTRCPLPNFCPLMSKNFAALQERLKKEFRGRFELLSISIDPRFDRPEVLKEYAGRYGADESCWRFATGDQEQVDLAASTFGLVHEPENGLIAHNLRTALIGPDGRLVHLWKSNVWTPYEVHRMMREALSETRALTSLR